MESARRGKKDFFRSAVDGREKSKYNLKYNLFIS